MLRIGHGKECDIWSSGVIAYLLLSGLVPFNGSDIEIRSKIQMGEYDFDEPIWQERSDLCKDFIRKMLVLDLTKRPTAEECL